jgi:hypothetical protein
MTGDRQTDKPKKQRREENRKMRPRVTEEIDKVREKKPMHWVVR